MSISSRSASFQFSRDLKDFNTGLRDKDGVIDCVIWFT
jgi:hypothetical protein